MGINNADVDDRTDARMGRFGLGDGLFSSVWRIEYCFYNDDFMQYAERS